MSSRAVVGSSFSPGDDPSGPIQWLNHDIVARRPNASHLQRESPAPLIAQGAKESHLEMA
ncbi:hypothetical protein GHK49_21070 [Sinorhizobium fredii]|nr:hypothetical protein [Sinorhizobium fredii]